MGRKRTITADQIFDAAQYVVGRDGAGQLTLDAVALEAGISKASILNLFTSKRALIQALIDRGVRSDAELDQEAIRRFSGADAPVVRGRIAAAASFLTEESRAVVLNLYAAAARDPELRRAAQNFQRSIIARIPKTSAHPRGAMLAHLALEGIKLLEVLDIYRWPPAERRRLLQDIEWLVEVDPPATNALRRRSPRASSGTGEIEASSPKRKPKSSNNPNRRRR